MFNKFKFIFLHNSPIFFVDIRDINVYSCQWKYTWYKYFTNITILTDFSNLYNILW